jgi:hypothetical protein
VNDSVVPSAYYSYVSPSDPGRFHNRRLARFARQIAIPKTVKDFHESCGYFCGKLCPREVRKSGFGHSEPLPKI